MWATTWISVAASKPQPTGNETSPSEIRTTRDSTPLAGITTDTGDFAPGFSDFSRFTTVDECLAAVDVIRDESVRTVPDQFAAFMSGGKSGVGSLPDAVFRVARRCEARLTLPGTPERDLPDLFALALLTENDSLVNAVLARRLALAKDDAARDTVRLQSVEMYLSALPPHLVAAESLVAVIDGVGATRPEARIQGHVMLLTFAEAHMDLVRMRREADRIIALNHLPSTSESWFSGNTLQAAYGALGEVAYLNYPDSMMAIMARGEEDVRRATGQVRPIDSVAAVQKFRDQLVPYNQDHMSSLQLPPIKAAYWYPKPVTMGNGPVLVLRDLTNKSCAKPGQKMQKEYSNELIRELIKSDFDLCVAYQTIIPQWERQYHDRLAIVVVANAGWQAVQSDVLTPAAMADTLGWFYHDHLGLPASVAVVADSVWQFPTPDGRRFSKDTTEFNRGDRALADLLRLGSGVPVVRVYDGRGTLRYAGNFDIPLLQILIARVMGESMAHAKGEP